MSMCPGSQTRPQHRPARDWLAAIEAGAVFVAIIFYIWWLRRVFSVSWLFILALIAASHCLRHEGAGRLGFRFSGLKEALTEVLPVLFFVILALLGGGLVFHTVRIGSFERFFWNLAIYGVWGLFQQYLLNGYFVNRLLAAFPTEKGRPAAVLAALLFALAHIPNIFLMAVTFVGGYVCARLYRKYRNLYLLGILHGTVGFTLNLTVPDSLSHSFVVGPGYFGK